MIGGTLVSWFWPQKSPIEPNDHSILPLAAVAISQDNSRAASILEQDDNVGNKLMEAFELDQPEQLEHEFACWLIRSVMLQGYIYLTKQHLLYYCSLPSTSEIVIKSGYLKQKSITLGALSYSTLWFVLKQHSLLVYNNATDIYYPSKVIHLKHGTVQQLEGSDFLIKTDKETITLRADTDILRQEWMSALNDCCRKSNDQDDVRIVIPFENVLSVEIAKTAINHECIKVTLIDQQSNLKDEYLFAYLNNVQQTHRIISDLWKDRVSNRIVHHRSHTDESKSNPDLGKKLSRRSWFGFRSTPTLQEDNPFYRTFGFPESEIFYGSFNCSLIRILPHIGKIYISSKHLSFKNHKVGIRCKAIIPYSEIVKIQKMKRYNVFVDSISILTREQEEILFDFHTQESCEQCYKLLMERMHLSNLKPKSPLDGIEHQDLHNLEYEELAKKPLIAVAKPDPMHITVMTVGTRGDVQPYVALCKGFMADGHRCRIATHLEYKDWVEGFGIEFREIKGNPAELMQACVDHGFLTVGFMRFAMQHLRGWFDALLDSCVSACEDTDMIIEAPTAFGGMHMAEKMGVPFFRTFTMPWTRTQVYPHPAMVPDVPLGSGYNYMTHVMIEQVLWKCMQPQINHWRTKTLGLPQLHLSSLAETKAPFLYNFSPLVVPPPFDWPDWIHTCGFWFLENSEHEWTPPQSLTDFLNNGSKPIYIGFGSIVVADPDELTRIIVEAVKLSGVRVILSKGWSGRMQKQEKEMVFPDSIYRIDRIPHDWLFPQCQAVMHHGGAGTTSAGLRAGVPTIVKPFFGDQFFWADRVQDLGVGISLRKMTVQKLSQALLSISNDTKIQGKAKLMGERIRAENGVQNAIQFVYRDLELAQQGLSDLKLKEK